MEKEKPQKYSLVTGEKIKKKSVKKIKKKHKVEGKKAKEEDKKLNKKISRFKRKHAIVEVTEAVDEFDKDKKPSAQTPQTKVLIIRKSDEPVSLKKRFLNLLSYALVGLIAVFFGYFSGNLYVANVLNKVDYSAFSEENLRDDGQAVYGKIRAELDRGVTVDRLESAGEGYSAVDIFVAAEYLLNTQEHYRSDVTGEIQPSIGKKQDVWGYKEKTGSIYDVENVSKGMLSVGEKIIYDANDKDNIKIYKATKFGDRIAEFSKEPTSNYTYDAFREEYGCAPETPMIAYIISSKTVVEGTESVRPLSVGRYQLTFNLTTDSSVINYIKQVKHMSGLEGYPTFSAITATAVVDSNLKLVSLRFDESYRVVYYGVMATCTGFLSNTITY